MPAGMRGSGTEPGPRKEFGARPSAASAAAAVLASNGGGGMEVVWMQGRKGKAVDRRRKIFIVICINDPGKQVYCQRCTSGVHIPLESE